MSIANIVKKINSRDINLSPKFTKKNKFIFVLITFIYITFFSQQIFAALSSETVEAFTKKQEAFKSKNNQENWMSESAISNTMIVVNALAGEIPPEVLKGEKPPVGWIPSGLIGFTNKNIASVYRPPFSGIEYLASIKNNFLGKPAYAVGIGFEGLSAILPIWIGFRNATYVIFSIIFIMTGLMIILRVKISPQAVITIQNSIPRLITALILVTFSYAIVGLIIDLSYAIQGVGLSIIFNASGGNPFALGESQPTISEILKDQNIIGITLNLVPLWLIASFTTLISGIITIIGGMVTFGPGAILGLWAYGIILTVTLILIFWSLLKFFFGLVKCYVSIILKTIIGPFEIALGAIPNMKMGFGSWITDIIANISVFPITVLFLTILNALISATSGKNLWMPPGINWINNLDFSDGGILPIAFGLGGLMLLSRLPKMIPEFIYQIKPSPWGKAIGEGFATVGGLSQKGAKMEASTIKYKFMSTNTEKDTGNYVGKEGGWEEYLWNRWDPRTRIK